jgi:hypothetical protein
MSRLTFTQPPSLKGRGEKICASFLSLNSGVNTQSGSLSPQGRGLR